VTVSILSSDGQIHAKDNALQIKFQDPAGHPIDAENVKLDLNTNMPGMVMHSGAKIEKVNQISDYQAHLTPNMSGDWSVDLSYEGPQGPAKLKVPVNVTQ
jgi:YtkA-like protein